MRKFLLPLLASLTLNACATLPAAERPKNEFSRYTLIFVEDDHAKTKEIAEKLKPLLPKFKEAGFKEIGLECSPKRQGAIDAFLKDGNEDLLYFALVFTYQNASGLVELIKAAKKNGLLPVCYDVEWEVGLNEVKLENLHLLEEREEHLANYFEKRLREGKKMVALIGMAHLVPGMLAFSFDGSEEHALNYPSMLRRLWSRLGEGMEKVDVISICQLLPEECIAPEWR